MFDIVTVGNFTIDSILLPHRQSPFVILGGSATYTSLAARRLGAKASVITSVGSDFPEAYKWWLTQEGIDLSLMKKVEMAQTTRFDLKYNADFSDRLLVLRNKGPQIAFEGLANFPKTNLIHVAPVADEITYELVEKLRGLTETLSIDPQGLLRKFDQNGIVTCCPLQDKRIFGLVDIYKSSLPEIKAATDTSDLDSAIGTMHKLGPRIVIVTLATEGAVISVPNAVHRISTYVPEKVVDPTGAGDAFMGGFLEEYVYGENFMRCGCVGSACASLVIEGIGPMSFGDKTEIYRRARLLYEKENKQ